MEAILGLSRTQSCPSTKELAAAEWHKERRHYDAPASQEFIYRPLKDYGIGISDEELRARDERPRGLKKVPSPQRNPAPQHGMKHFVIQSRARSSEIAHIAPRKRVVLDDGGVPCRLRAAEQYNLEKAMGKKVTIDNILDRRNGIGYRRPGDKLYSAPEYSTGYFINSQHGGGVVPGSNFGFASATQTTKESIKVFGKSLAEMWARSPKVPAVLAQCLEYLQEPHVIEQAEVFLSKAAVQEYTKDPDAPSTHDDDGGLFGQDTGRQSVGSHFSHTSKMSRMSRMSHASRLTVTRSLSRRASRPDWLIEDSAARQNNAEQIAEQCAARTKQMRAFRAKFDADRASVISFSRDNVDPRVVFGLLIQFLREMDPPLLTYDLFDRLLSTQLEHKMTQRVEALRPTLALIPPPHEASLFALIRFLYLLQQDRPDIASTKILSRIFAPLLLREDKFKPKSAIHKGEAVVNTLREQVLQCMLDHVAQVFPASVLQPRRPPGADIPCDLRRPLWMSLEDVMDIADLDGWERQNLGSGRSISTSAREEEDEEAKLNEADVTAQNSFDQRDCYDAELTDLLQSMVSRHSTPTKR